MHGRVERLIDQPITLDVVVGFLVTAPLFGGLDAAERGEVVRIMEVQRLQAGEEVFHEGDAGEAWYVIFEGQVSVMKSCASGPDRTLRLLGPGECFGEMAILDGSPRSATVKAATPITIFRFRRPPFEELLADGSLGAYKLVLAMARAQAQRLRQLTHQLSHVLDGTATDQAAVGELLDRSTIAE